MSTFDPYHKWLGIPKAEQPPHHYRLLGLSPFESDPAIIEQAARRQIAYVRECADGGQLGESEALLDELSAARDCLLDPSKKRAYDAELEMQLTPPAGGQAPRRRDFTPSNRPMALDREDDDEVDDEVILLADEPSRPYAGATSRTRASSHSGRKWIYWLLGGAGALLLLLVLLAGGFVYFANQMAFKQIKEIELASDAGNDHKPVLQEPADLLKLIDLKQGTVRGDWRFEGDTLVSPDTAFALLQIPVKPSPSYVLTATVETASIQDCLVLGLVVGSRQVTLAFNGFGNTASGLQLVDRKIILYNETKTGPVLVAGQPNHIVCSVSTGHIEVTCNGRIVVNWSGDFKRLLAGPDWQPPVLHRFYIGSYLTSYRITQLDYRPIELTEDDARPSP